MKLVWGRILRNYDMSFMAKLEEKWLITTRPLFTAILMFKRFILRSIFWVHLSNERVEIDN